MQTRTTPSLLASSFCCKIYAKYVFVFKHYRPVYRSTRNESFSFLRPIPMSLVSIGETPKPFHNHSLHYIFARIIDLLSILALVHARAANKAMCTFLEWRNLAGVEGT